MKLHKNTISFDEVQKIVTNKKLKEGDLETFLFHQEGKNIFSFKNKVDINVNLSEKIKMIKMYFLYLLLIPPFLVEVI